MRRFHVVLTPAIPSSYQQLTAVQLWLRTASLFVVISPDRGDVDQPTVVQNSHSFGRGVHETGQNRNLAYGWNSLYVEARGQSPSLGDGLWCALSLLPIGPLLLLATDRNRNHATVWIVCLLSLAEA